MLLCWEELGRLCIFRPESFDEIYIFSCLRKGKGNRDSVEKVVLLPSKPLQRNSQSLSGMAIQACWAKFFRR